MFPHVSVSICDPFARIAPLSLHNIAELLCEQMGRVCCIRVAFEDAERYAGVRISYVLWLLND